MRGSCLFKVGIFLLVNLIEIQGENLCTGTRESGLLANILGIGTSNSRATDIFQCCTQAEVCPEIKSDSLDTGSRVTVIGLDSELQRKFVNRLCPVGWQSCEYDQNQVEADPSIENTCTTPKELNEFATCQQGCAETGISPKSDKKSDSNNYPDPGQYPDFDDLDFSALIERSDSIQGSFEDLDKRCGTRSFQETALPDNQAALGEFPWACSVFTRGQDEKYVGGCVIVPNSRDNSVAEPTYKIVTAASKLAKVGKTEQLKVRIRFTDLKKGNFEDDYNVAQFISHPKFDKKRLSDNIAIMFLEKPLDLIREDGINAACLPACNNMFDHTFVNNTGVRCWSAGFGAKEKGGQETFILTKTDIPIFPDRAKCETEITKALREVTKRPRLRPTVLTPGELCAGGEPGKDTCSGDGGSPLVCQAVSGRWHVVGLVSWGIGCGVAGRPAIYTNVFHYLDFIYEAKQNGNGDWIGDWSKFN
jgi:hypothetical protein